MFKLFLLLRSYFSTFLHFIIFLIFMSCIICCLIRGNSCPCSFGTALAGPLAHSESTRIRLETSPGHTEACRDTRHSNYKLAVMYQHVLLMQLVFPFPPSAFSTVCLTLRCAHISSIVVHLPYSPTPPPFFFSGNINNKNTLPVGSVFGVSVTVKGECCTRPWQTAPFQSQ